MTPIDWAIAAGALTLIVLVNWYFLGPRRVVGAAPAAAGGGQDLTVVVEGGYTPNAIEVSLGTRVRLTFDRREDNPCSDEVVIPDFSIRRGLPAFAKTVIEFTADKPGRHEFRCGMGMLHGALIVR
jgi:plastocyanin domain-containing protein